MSTWNRCHFVFERNSSGAPLRGSSTAFARHLHVAAERNRADRVFRVAAARRDQLGTEPERKREHADADAAGREEVTELVHEHQHAEHEQKRQDCRHAFNSSAWAVCRAHSRAQLSTRRTTSSVVTLSICVRVHRFLYDARNGCKAELPVEKRLHGDFVGRI